MGSRRGVPGLFWLLAFALVVALLAACGGGGGGGGEEEAAPEPTQAPGTAAPPTRPRRL